MSGIAYDRDCLASRPPCTNSADMSLEGGGHMTLSMCLCTEGGEARGIPSGSNAI